MGLTELDDMVGALAANRSDVRSRGLTAVPCPDRNRGSGNVRFVPRKCLRDLMCDPLDANRCDGPVRGSERQFRAALRFHHRQAGAQRSCLDQRNIASDRRVDHTSNHGGISLE